MMDKSEWDYPPIQNRPFLSVIGPTRVSTRMDDDSYTKSTTDSYSAAVALAADDIMSELSSAPVPPSAADADTDYEDNEPSMRFTAHTKDCGCFVCDPGLPKSSPHERSCRCVGCVAGARHTLGCDCVLCKVPQQEHAEGCACPACFRANTIKTVVDKQKKDREERKDRSVRQQQGSERKQRPDELVEPLPSPVSNSLLYRRPFEDPDDYLSKPLPGYVPAVRKQMSVAFSQPIDVMLERERSWAIQELSQTYESAKMQKQFSGIDEAALLRWRNAMFDRLRHCGSLDEVAGVKQSIFKSLEDMKILWGANKRPSSSTSSTSTSRPRINSFTDEGRAEMVPAAGWRGARRHEKPSNNQPSKFDRDKDAVVTEITNEIDRLRHKGAIDIHMQSDYAEQARQRIKACASRRDVTAARDEIMAILLEVETDNATEKAKEKKPCRAASPPPPKPKQEQAPPPLPVIAAAPPVSSPPPAQRTLTLCVVCEERDIDQIILPCAHIATCKTCLDIITSQADKEQHICPVCRGPIVTRQTVYVCSAPN